MFQWLWNLFGIGFGLALGCVLGISVGPYIFPDLLKPKDFSFLDESSDEKEDIQAPEAGTPVSASMRSLLEYTEPWTTSPDYQRTHMLNRCIKILWPTLKVAIIKQIKTIAKAQLKDIWGKVPFIEDIVLGTDGLKEDGVGDFSGWVDGKRFDLGDIPLRIGGIKNYDTGDDEVILEAPLLWGSSAQLNVGVFFRLGMFRLYVPLEISNIQLKVDARITLKPLLDVIPFFGGLTVSLLKVPHVDLKLVIIRGVDLMALPVVKDGVKLALKYILEGMIVLPNKLSIPILPNFGLPPAPKGALNIKLLRSEGVKGARVYTELEIRKGRPVCSESQKESNGVVEFNEEFHLIIDDFEQQSLKAALFNDDLGWNDTLLAAGELPFGKVEGEQQDDKGNIFDGFSLAEFIKVPMSETLVEIDLSKCKSRGLVKTVSKGMSTILRASASKEGERPSFDDDEEDEGKKKAKKKTVFLPSTRAITSHVSLKLKGVLTINLIRCINLAGNDINAYVRFLVSDEDRDLVQKSTPVFSQQSPRWGQKFDFVMINAGSALHIHVFAKTGVTSSVVNFFSSSKRSEDKDRSLGRLTVPVKDVVRNGFIKDIWTLQDAEKGQIELALSWQTCYVSDE